eukprot:TRINITY_DN234_c0_g1_i2.p1 TRINITY_DN234_c0_g1~~TRINITY_DN234_c0_g1_i2.p1  ORF type:complete len:405 (-),score=73.16 TRINITY_DN234_c0_g1_i2:514-1728(-)
MKWLLFLSFVIVVFSAVPTQTEIDKILQEHNNNRTIYGCPSLVWDSSIASIASSYSEQLASTCGLTHSGNGYGENLAMYPGSWSGERGVRLWNDEKVDWRCSDSSCNSGKVCGHFTQNIWKNTKSIGCGIGTCSNGYKVLVCNYYPAGNYIGQHPLGSSSSCPGSPPSVPVPVPVTPPVTAPVAAPVTQGSTCVAYTNQPCITPPPQYGITETCFTFSGYPGRYCFTDPNSNTALSCTCTTATPVNCLVSDWSCGSCSATCGGGSQTCTRSVLVAESNGGTCPERSNLNKVQSCNTQSCPQPTNCVATNWECDTCSATCGGGVRNCRRSIVINEANGGTCPERSMLSYQESCNTDACPQPAQDCLVSDWSCNSCSASCGGGIQTCIRDIIIPESNGYRCMRTTK